MLTHSRDGEFFFTPDGHLYQQVSFPDPVGVRIGHLDSIDPEDAPDRIRPSIAELLDRWTDSLRDSRLTSDLASDHRAASLSR